MFQRGDVAEFIYRIQRVVGVKQDGDFDSGTEAALKRWQSAHGLEADGIAGPETLSAMGLLDQCWIENGDKAALVKIIQARLSVRVDGRFGNATEAAVERFQQENGLTADGIAGPKTLAALGVLEAVADKSEAKPAQPSRQPAPAPTSVPASAPAPTSATTARTTDIRSWAYQLADIDPTTIEKLDVDIIVIDYSRDGEDATAFKPAEVARMKQRPGGGREASRLLHEHRRGRGLSLLLARRVEQSRHPPRVAR